MGLVQQGAWEELLVQLTNVSAVVTLENIIQWRRKLLKEMIRASENLQSLRHWLITVKLS